MNNNQNYLVPGAIVLAGLLIAGAVIYVQGLPGGKPTTGLEEGTVGNPVEVAKAIGLNTKDFQECYESGRYADDVDADVVAAEAAGGAGTPYFVIVGESIEGAVIVSGAQPKANFEKALDMARGNADLIAYDENIGFGYLANLSESISPEDHIRGNVDAPITIIEYSDLECPFCQVVHPTIQSLVSENSDVSWVYRHLPLEAIHPSARPLAEGSECAAELGGNDAFWAFLDKVFEE
ncbi:MAG: hypothetical protein COT89_02815 [Candidatus Colwellbacteria bacterium CG10_big_fil_rev_8_21_14_0_10_42_22]|uniref:Thioredoxin domain-containing protein n=1 Tax=Candidatus Colwellbacteria bacterium CG10_big_fil_rev_8_21_14_0_10_42_22 TaxID=1974540 RepID=A0A2H0VFD2_9BACT|nr:MAG: hypothetical protein COT89_02815 [Candidatus Colwellbacteria bacterium CG10_big_fil_rev_8_21_14_0_10_42_22]